MAGCLLWRGSSQLPLDSTQVRKWTSAGITALWVVQMHMTKSFLFMSLHICHAQLFPVIAQGWTLIIFAGQSNYLNGVLIIFFSILLFPLLLFLTFCYFFSFVGVYHPSHHEGHPTLSISNFGFVSFLFSSCLRELPARVAPSLICRSLVNSNGLQQSLQLSVSCC